MKTGKNLSVNIKRKRLTPLVAHTYLKNKQMKAGYQDF
jgi:hypothetical protein